MSHTEHVHILFGIGLTLTGALWLGGQTPVGHRLRYVWPLILVAVGVFLVIPTETQERTYVPVDAWNTFLSVFPNSLSVWLTTVQKVHVIQHKVSGLCAIVAGAIEEGRACGWLTTSRWHWALPLLTIAAGLAIGIHGGTHRHLPRVVEQAHHWIMGGAFVLGGVAQGIAVGYRRDHPGLRRVLPALVLLAGLDLALLYRLH
jgi:hypothetical protein